MKSQHRVGQCSIEYPRPHKITLAELIAGIALAGFLGGMIAYSLVQWWTL